MAFAPATYNVTLFGPLASRGLPSLASNFPHFNYEDTRSVDRLSHVLNFTEQSNFESILKPLETKFRNPQLVNQSFRRSSNVSKSSQNNRSRNSRVSRHSRLNGHSDSTGTITFSDLHSKADATDYPSQIDGLVTNTLDHTFIATTTSPAIKSTVKTEHQLGSPLENSLTHFTSSMIPATAVTPHGGGHVPLMDTRSPEHADLFESSRVRGPVAVRTSSSAPEVVTPRLSLPSPSPTALKQLPVLWTALSLALGVEVQGEIVRGLPCIKRLNQLFCRNAGTSYPAESIETFIDDNKALTRRMYGEFQSDLGLGEIVDSALRSLRRVRSVNEMQPSSKIPVANYVINNITEVYGDLGQDDLKKFSLMEESWNEIWHEDKMHGSVLERIRRQASSNKSPPSVPPPPTRTTNSDRRSSTKRCNGDCGCEQKYKWHRMLAYDLENECKGVFVDWFLFPSCCVCRCDP